MRNRLSACRENPGDPAVIVGATRAHVVRAIPECVYADSSREAFPSNGGGRFRGRKPPSMRGAQPEGTDGIEETVRVRAHLERRAAAECVDDSVRHSARAGKGYRERNCSTGTPGGFYPPPEVPITVAAQRESISPRPRCACGVEAYRRARVRRRLRHAFSARRARLAYALFVVLTLQFRPTPVLANVIGAVNRARAAYCGHSLGSLPALAANRTLNEVARLLAHGESLDQAEHRAGYRAQRSVWIQMTGATDPAAVAQWVSRRFCGQLADPRLRDIGTYRSGKNALWIVVAQPFRTPPEQDAAAVSRRVLQLTNQARTHWRTCGSRRYPPAPPLALSPALTRAAYAHSRDMAAHDFFSHTGSDGSSPGKRVARAGYRWKMVGENIASGVGTPQKVVADWLASPHHCANIMTAGYRQMGVAFAISRRSGQVIYWTEDFGSPR